MDVYADMDVDAYTDAGKAQIHTQTIKMHPHSNIIPSSHQQILKGEKP